MKNYNYIIIAMMFLLSFAGISTVMQPVQAQETEAEIVERIKARDAQLDQIKDQGKAGENLKGLVSLLEADDAARRLVNAENKDRQKLFEIIASQEADATVEIVAEVYRQRMYTDAKMSHFLQDEDGSFKRKSELVE